MSEVGAVKEKKEGVKATAQSRGEGENT